MTDASVPPLQKSGVSVCVRTHTCACVLICVYVQCVHVCARTHECMYAYGYRCGICANVCMYVCMCSVCICVLYVCVCTSMWVCVCAYLGEYVYVQCMYIHVYV